ncbi:MAG TPA: peptidoglycan DD-metalloendopeptidase family protein [Rhodanobacteraceae bacterium]|nr:peptidoglycan DD-metalloendopeptidase family protein [Rhodanobacteraceae bacterium]
MRHSIFLLSIAAALLAGCASNPAPVVDRSLGGEAPPQASTMSATPNSGGGQHANGSTTAQGYVVARGDTLYSIAFKHGLDYRALAARNDIASPYVIHPGQVLRLDEGSGAPAAVAEAPRAPATANVSHGNAAPVFGSVETAPVETHAEATASNVQPPSNSTTLPTVNLQRGSTPAQTIVRPGATPPQAPTVAAAPAEASTAGAAVAPVTSPPLSRAAAGRTRAVDGITWQWPADGAVISGSDAGLDIAGNEGDPVRAAADGVVVYSGNGLIGYGELIIIKHSDNYLSAYGHNRKRLVQEGQHVRAGQQIAEMGSTGAPREELHFEIRKNGKQVDPTDYLPGR